MQKNLYFIDILNNERHLYVLGPNLVATTIACNLYDAAKLLLTKAILTSGINILSLPQSLLRNTHVCIHSDTAILHTRMLL